MKYYDIDEEAARIAHEGMSFDPYPEGRLTMEYRVLCDAAAEMADLEKARKPEYAQAIDALLDRYARKLADWTNKKSAIDAMCPSVLVTGSGDFPTKKKQKQNERMDAHMAKLAEIDKLLDKMRSIGTGGIRADEENALVRLEAKLEDLKEFQETMKGVNSYWRKHKTLDGCDLISKKNAENLMDSLRGNPGRMPFESYYLANNNAEIHRIEKRIKDIRSIKEAGSSENDVSGVDGLRLVEDAESMRIQLVFDGKPDESVREILKKWGFRWAPSHGAWQRQLNQNGKYAARQAIEEIQALDVELVEP